MTRSARLPRACAAALLLTVLLGGIRVAHACLWDEDTLAMEKHAFPSALELITGRFPRHGEAYYRWRIAERQKRVDAGTATLEDLDDLAVAHEKVGDPEEAIRIMRAAEAREPDRYRTVANLGTFLIHAGKLEEGLQEIRRAIRINPDAHFGREIYQALLVEYVLSKREDGTLPLPMWPEAAQGMGIPPDGFARHVLAHRELVGDGADPARQAEEIQAAVKGVLGMMRFGNHASPVLLEALGDLLTVGEPGRDFEGSARLLAARAYLVAARGQEGATRTRYREKAQAVLDMQRSANPDVMRMRVEEVEETLEQELAAAEELRKRVLADEQRWIDEGEDPSARFQETYMGQRPLPSRPPVDPDDLAGGASDFSLLAVLAVLLLLVAAVAIVMGRRRGPRR